MYLYWQKVIFLGLCLMLPIVFPYKENIKILTEDFNSETNTNATQIKCMNRNECDNKNVNQTTTFTNENVIEYSKNIYVGENSQEKESEPPISHSIDTKDVKLPASVNDIKNNKYRPIELNTITIAKSENTTNIDKTADINKTTENILTELTPLSEQSDMGQHTGQIIELQRSKIDSDDDITNQAGVEILKNMSSVCGTLLGKRISFANETTLMEFPWTALLLYNTKGKYHCGGSLITTKYVLTAAHCVAQEFYELTGVRLGEYDISKEKDCAPDIVGEDICSTTVDVVVMKIIIHHSYSHLSFKNDIALLRLEEHYYGRSYYPICIPAPDSTYTDTKAMVAGWGSTEKAIRSTLLRKAEVPILDVSKCRSIYRYTKFNDTTEICGSGVNEVDVCQGDSGGAIFYRESIKSKDIYFQLGIISLGVRRCGDRRFLPAVFTKLKGFYKWIENNLEY